MQRRPRLKKRSNPGSGGEEIATVAEKNDGHQATTLYSQRHKRRIIKNTEKEILEEFRQSVGNYEINRQDVKIVNSDVNFVDIEPSSRYFEQAKEEVGS